MQPLGAAKLALAVIAVGARCGACSVTIIHNPVQVGLNFRVFVQDRGQPIEGFQVEIQGKQGDAISSIADRNGFAFFRGVPPGSYLLTSRVQEGIFSGVELEAKPEGRDVTIPFHWPSSTLVLVRSLKGVMHASAYRPGQPEPRLLVELLDARSGQKLKRSQTNEQGEFDFEIDAPGRYFLSLPYGVIPVVVDHSAPAHQLDLDLGLSSCGIYYTQRTDCPQPDLRMDQLSGIVLDPAEAVVPNARIFLLDAAGTLVEQLESNSTGEFAAPASLGGAYSLIIEKPGFTTLHGTLQLERPSDARGPSHLSIQLGVLGTCGEVRRR